MHGVHGARPASAPAVNMQRARSSRLERAGSRILRTGRQGSGAEEGPPIRRLVAFVGGLDLTEGRYDTHDHPLFATRQQGGPHEKDTYQGCIGGEAAGQGTATQRKVPLAANTSAPQHTCDRHLQPSLPACMDCRPCSSTLGWRSSGVSLQFHGCDSLKLAQQQGVAHTYVLGWRGVCLCCLCVDWHQDWLRLSHTPVSPGMTSTRAWRAQWQQICSSTSWKGGTNRCGATGPQPRWSHKYLQLCAQHAVPGTACSLAQLQRARQQQQCLCWDTK